MGEPEFVTEAGRQRWEEDLQRIKEFIDPYEESFTINQVWHDYRMRLNYNRISRVLLALWRRGYLEKCDGDGVWHVGHSDTPMLRRRHEALYRWPADSEG